MKKSDTKRCFIQNTYILKLHSVIRSERIKEQRIDDLIFDGPSPLAKVLTF